MDHYNIILRLESTVVSLRAYVFWPMTLRGSRNRSGVALLVRQFAPCQETMRPEDAALSSRQGTRKQGHF